MSQPSDAQKAFDNLKKLAGSWQGAIMGISINVTIRLASSGTAILHEATTDGGHPPNHEITMFYVDGDRLLATHYCDGGNRARFDGKMSPETVSRSSCAANLNEQNDDQLGVVSAPSAPLR